MDSNASLHGNKDLGCTICKAFLEAATEITNQDSADLSNSTSSVEPSEQKWKLGGLGEVFGQPQCQAHEDLIESCVGKYRYRSPEFMLVLYGGRLSIQVGYQDDDDRIWWTSPAEFLVCMSSPDLQKKGLGLGRALSEYIDMGLLRQWKSICTTHHEHKCETKLLTLHQPPGLLIDCERQCLVPTPKGASYVAVSYIWGQTPTLMAKKENVDKLQQDGILLRLGEEIAPTIRDCIKLVPMLDERYLWVDALCIIQDDEEFLSGHISHMAAVYENATLTIVMADARDANSGVPGIKNISPPRTLKPVLKLNDDITISVREDDIIRWSPWTMRGWTMQEQIFSRKKLVFFDNCVRWICRSNTYYEDIMTSYDLDLELLAVDGGETRDNFSPFDISLNVPDVSILCDLISHYNRRDLTFDGDVTAAFASTFFAMKEAFPRGFLHGIPISFFDIALLWRSGQNSLRRRETSEGVEAIPSWSWKGWQGYLLTNCWTSKSYMKDPPYDIGRAHWEPHQIIPSLTWYTTKEKDAPRHLLAYQNEWHEYKACYMGKREDLPAGWTFMEENSEAERERIAGCLESQQHRRQEERDCKVSFEELQTSYFYQHASQPERKFWHPVPFGDISKTGDDFALPLSYGRYLCADTQQARLWAARPHYNTTIDRAVSYEGLGKYVVPMFGIALGVTAVFKNAQGDEIGELCVDSASDLENILAEESGVLCDVVMVSRGLSYTCPQPVGEETWSFYNVLWVVWVDGVACRRGVGRIRRKDWEEIDKEDISLILG